MHIITEDTKNLIILIPKDICDDDKVTTVKEIKKFLLTYNKIYHFLAPGFYQVEVSFNQLVGTILEISRLDDFDFDTSTIDLRIVLVGKKKIGLELLDPRNLKKCYVYQNKLYISDDELDKKVFLSLVEHSRIVLHDEITSVLSLGQKIYLQNKSSLKIREQ